MKNRKIIDDCLALLTSWTASVKRKGTHLRRLTMTMRFLFLFGRIAASGVAMNKKSKRKKKNLGIRWAGRWVAPGSIAGLC